MQLEFHQLDLRFEHLRIRQPRQQGRLLASLAEKGQQMPIIVVATTDPRRYLVIDGHKRIAALKQLRRDTVEALVWPLSETEAVLLDRTRRFSQQETGLEQGWLLMEMQERRGCSQEELARRFDRSVSWVSRRMALVKLLPPSVQQHVRQATIAAHVAMKYLVPVARIGSEDCQRMAEAFASHRCSARQAGQLYRAWREGSRQTRQRILAEPQLFLKTQVQPAVPVTTEAAALSRDLEIALASVQRANRRLTVALAEMDGNELRQAQQKIGQTRSSLEGMAQRMKQEEEEHAKPTTTQSDCGVERTESKQDGDCAPAEGVAAERTQSAARGFDRGSAPSTGGKSRTVPPTDPRTVEPLQGKSGASP